MKEKRSSFLNPATEYRPLQLIHGFDTLKEGILEGLDGLEAAGLGGIVTNVGFAHGYFGNPQQWEVFLQGIEEAEKRDLAIWLYDEQGYPSGTAGGKVLEQHPEYEALGISCQAAEGIGPAQLKLEPLPAGMLQVLHVCVIDETGKQHPVAAGEHGEEIVRSVSAGQWRLVRVFTRHPYAGTHASTNVFQFRRYINVLNHKAVRRFLDLTHEVYDQKVGRLFGKKIQAFFSDEPSFMTPYIWPIPTEMEGKVPIKDPVPQEARYPTLPWLEEFPQLYRQRWKEDLEPDLPFLFSNLTARASQVREQYYELVTELFISAYTEQIQSWCQAHGVNESGHFLAEESLRDQVGFTGDLFRLAGSMGIPGIDMLSSSPERIMADEDWFMAAKQVSSAAHLYGRRRVMCETSDWMDCNFPKEFCDPKGASLAQMKGTANLLYCLGVNVIASYYDWRMPGFAEYTQYVGRLGSILAESAHQAKCALLYPIRSAWIHFQPSTVNIWESSQSALFQRIITAYPQVARALLRSQIDFDIVDEQSVCRAKIDGGLKIGDECYQYLILPPLDRCAPKTQAKLEQFVAAGGNLTILAEPSLAGWAAELRGKGNVVLGKVDDSPAKWLPNPVDDWEITVHEGAILASKWAKENREILFIINNSAQKASCALSWDGITECLWPESGDSTPWENKLLQLAPYGAVFVLRARSA